MQQLGKWLKGPTPIGWYYEAASNWLWHVGTAAWSLYTTALWRSRTQACLATTASLGQNLPLAQLCRAMVVKCGAQVILTGDCAICRRKAILQHPLYWLGHLELFKAWKGNIQFEGKWETRQQELIQGLGFTMSHGSYKSGQGTAAWIIEGQSSEHRVL